MELPYLDSVLMCTHSLVQISFASSSTILNDRSRFKSLFRTLPCYVYVAPTLAVLMREFNWKQMAMISDDTRTFRRVSVCYIIMLVIIIIIDLYYTLIDFVGVFWDRWKRVWFCWLWPLLFLVVDIISSKFSISGRAGQKHNIICYCTTVYSDNDQKYFRRGFV